MCIIIIIIFQDQCMYYNYNYISGSVCVRYWQLGRGQPRVSYNSSFPGLCPLAHQTSRGKTFKSNLQNLFDTDVQSL